MQMERLKARMIICSIMLVKVYDGFLYLDEISDGAKDEMLNNFLRPENRFAKADRMEEFLEMTSLSDKIVVPTFEVFTSEPSDIEFIEGNRKRVEHFRVERSGLLKKYYKKVNPNPVCCACGADMSKRYPWTDFICRLIFARGLNLVNKIPLTFTAGLQYF